MHGRDQPGQHALAGRHARAGNAVPTVGISADYRFAAGAFITRVCIRVCTRTCTGILVVLMGVVTEVLGLRIAFMPPVHGHGRPAELERQQGQQEDRKTTAHSGESSCERDNKDANKDEDGAQQP